MEIPEFRSSLDLGPTLADQPSAYHVRTFERAFPLDEIFMSVTCWAAALGDCSTVQSREHYISKGLWSRRTITVSGFDWLKGKTRTLRIESLTGKILCTTHNNLLSPLDAEAARLFEIVDKIADLSEIRQRLKPRKVWNVVTHSRSERVAGDAFKLIAREKGKHRGKKKSRGKTSIEAATEEVGITKATAHRWQAVADVPEEKFEKVHRRDNSVSR